MPDRHRPSIRRRDFLRVAAGVATGVHLGWEPKPLLAEIVPGPEPAPRRVVEHDIVVDRAGFRVDDRHARAPMINGSVPGPLIRLREGEDAVLRVTNRMDEVTSIHWHGLLVPADQDGVPGFSFDGIAPGETFTYRFHVRQAGTYWCHSHSGGQEQEGMYAPLVIDPAGPDPVAYDREHTLVLSDWTDEEPMSVLRNLKGDGAYYNYGKRTLPGLVRSLFGRSEETLSERAMWGRMRMDPTDISDVTGATYSYLLNGMSTDGNWTGTFEPGERVRLRIINAAAMTFFDVRVPGLAMSVVQADGQDVEPVSVDEIRIGVAETYDVVVEPGDAEAYTIFAQAMDRSGYARGTLSRRDGATAQVPSLDPRPVRTMAMMPMADGMDHEGMAEDASEEVVDHAAMGHTTDEAPEVDHAAMGHGEATSALRRLDYADLRAYVPNADVRTPTRDVVMRLTGDMERYFWTLNDEKLADAEPVRLTVGERVRLVMTNETMMEHPMHLHGVFMELQNGAHPAFAPRKHTIIVPPNASVEAHMTFDEPGAWAFHCHLLFHMMTGMFGRFEVTEAAAEEAS